MPTQWNGEGGVGRNGASAKSSFGSWENNHCLSVSFSARHSPHGRKEREGRARVETFDWKIFRTE